MRKFTYSTLLLSGFLMLTNISRSYSQEEKAVWYDDQPWSVQSNPNGLDPYYGLDEEDREKIAKRHFRRAAKEEGKKIIMNYEIAEKIKRRLTKLRDKRLTLRVGEIPEEIKTETDEYLKTNPKGKSEKGFLIIRPGKSGLEIAAQNPTHLKMEGEAGIRGINIKASPTFKVRIPFTEKKISLPTFETGYDIGDGFFVGAKYKKSF